MGRLDDMLVEGWRQALKWWSVQWQLVSGLIMGVVLMVPSMPTEIQELLPPKLRALLVAGWIALGIWARLKKQGGSHAG